MNALDPAVLNAEREWNDALSNAFLLKDESGIQELFKKGVQPFNARSPWKQGDPVGTLEKAIAFKASPAVVQKLLDARALPTTFNGQNKLNALDNLLQNPQYPDAMVESLLQAKATPTQPDEFFHDDDHLCTLDHAVAHRSREVVQLLVDAKAYATLFSYRKLPTPSYGARRDETNEHRKTLDLLRIATENGKTAREQARQAERQKWKQEQLNTELSTAVFNGKGDEIQRLLDAKAEVSADMLDHAIRRAPAAVVDLLLKAKALPNADAFTDAVLNCRPTAVFRSLLDANVQLPQEALLKALLMGCEEGVVSLLVEKGWTLSRHTFERIPENRLQLGKEPYSEETMRLLEGAVSREEAKAAPAPRQPANWRPVEEAAVPPNDADGEEEVNGPMPGEEPFSRANRRPHGILGCIALIFAGICDCIDWIFSSITDYFSDDGGEHA